MGRYDHGTVSVVGLWTSTDGSVPGPRLQARLGGHNVATAVFETRRPARIDDFKTAIGPAADIARDLFGHGAAVGVPIGVEGRLWGVMIAGSGEPLAQDAEARLAVFTELVGVAIAASQARMELVGNAEEQAALRRVATLVARGAIPEEVFTAVAEESGRLVSGDYTTLSR